VRIGIVVARCDESLPWLTDVQRGLLQGAAGSASRSLSPRPATAAPKTAPLLELYVYELCASADLPYLDEDAWPRMGWHRERRIQLRDRGDACYAYLHFLRDMYAWMPDAVLFMHGDATSATRHSLPFSPQLSAAPSRVPSLGRQTRSFGRLLFHSIGDTHVPNMARPSLFRSVVVGAASISAYGIPYVSIAANPTDCIEVVGLGLDADCEGLPRQFECIQQLHERHGLTRAFASRLPRAYAVYANAQFAVTRDRITQRPLTFYEGLLREFDGADETACFRIESPAPALDAPHRARPHRGTCALFEYLWPTIFGEPPVLDPRRTMSGERADRPRLDA
jgi:hypothetical protein